MTITEFIKGLPKEEVPFLLDARLQAVRPSTRLAAVLLVIEIKFRRGLINNPIINKIKR